jgi:hypothetical protein
MVNVFRGAILASLVSAAVALFLPLNATRFTVPLHQPGDPVTGEQLAAAVGLLAVPLCIVALVLAAVAAVGLFGFRAWARPMAKWTTLLVAGCFAASLWLSPMPMASAMTTTHAMVLVGWALAWATVLLLLRSAPIRNRFSTR